MSGFAVSFHTGPKSEVVSYYFKGSTAELIEYIKDKQTQGWIYCGYLLTDDKVY